MNRLGALVEQVTVRRLADGAVRIDAWRPGPAGVSVARFAGGRIVVSFDTAEGDHVTAILLEEPRSLIDRRHPVLQGLLDDDTASALIGWWSEDPSPDSDPIVLWAGRPEPGLDDPQARARAAAGTRLRSLIGVGRFALAAEAAVRRNLMPGLTALALAETAVLAVINERMEPIPDASRLSEAAFGHLARLDRSDDSWLGALEGPDLDRLVARVERWRPVLDGLSGGSQILHRFDRAALDAADARAPAAGRRLRKAPAPAAVLPPSLFDAAARTAEVDIFDASAGASASVGRTVEVLFAGDVSADARLIRSTMADEHLTVHVGGAPEADLWLRVFRPDTPPTIIALVPFDPPGRSWRTARAVVPEETIGEGVLVDVTGRPQGPWCSADGNDFARAVRLGVDAARASRRGDNDAPDRWADCADAWSRYGDPRRSERAAQLAEHEAGTGRRTSRRFGPPDFHEGPLAADLFDRQGWIA